MMSSDLILISAILKWAGLIYCSQQPEPAASESLCSESWQAGPASERKRLCVRMLSMPQSSMTSRDGDSRLSDCILLSGLRSRFKGVSRGR